MNKINISGFSLAMLSVVWVAADSYLSADGGSGQAVSVLTEPIPDTHPIIPPSYDPPPEPRISLPATEPTPTPPPFDYNIYHYFKRLNQGALPPMYNPSTGVNWCWGWARRAVELLCPHLPTPPNYFNWSGSAYQVMKKAQATPDFIPWPHNHPENLPDLFPELKPGYLIFFNVGPYGHVGVIYRTPPTTTHPEGQICIIHNLSKHITKWCLEGAEPGTVGLPEGWECRIGGIYRTW